MRLRLLIAIVALVAGSAYAANPTRTSGIRICESSPGTNCISILPPASITSDQTGVLDDDSTPFDPLVTQIRVMTFMLGADNGATLVDGDDQPTIFWNRTGLDATILEVGCESDAGTPSINLQIDDGSAANVLSSNLTCTTSGATSSTFVGGEDAVLDSEKLDFVMVAAGGAAKRVTVSILYQLE